MMTIIFGEIDHRSRSILETDVFDVKALDKVKSILLQSMSWNMTCVNQYVLQAPSFVLSGT